MNDQATALSMRGITKRFGSLTANKDISLDLARGEILALLGENGAGKSTLVSILFGHYVADEGNISVFGSPLPAGDPAAALAAGVGMVHQHFALADRLSVLENIIAGTAPLSSLALRTSKARERLLDLAARFGLVVDPDRQVGQLSIGQRQRVEILKALYRGAKILILDEPTAVLTPQESEALFETLGQFVEQGLSIVFISHKLDEVLHVSNRIAVLRAGELVATLESQSADRDQLAELMVGHSVVKPSVSTGLTAEPSRLVAALKGASARGQPGIHDVNLSAHSGQILGIAGVSGNGQQTLADVLCGLCTLQHGTFDVEGTPIAADPRALLAAGVARIPEDRHAVGSIGDLPVWENAIIEQVRAPVFSHPWWLLGLVKAGRARAFARALVQRFDVRGLDAQGVYTSTRSLSGGNMQKLILGRALSGLPDDDAAAFTADVEPRAPALIVANQPTWGLDVGAVAAIHQRLLDAAAAGSAVILISEDLEELFSVADAIAVMVDGRLSAPKPSRAWTMSAIGLAMSGSEAANDNMVAHDEA